MPSLRPDVSEGTYVWAMICEAQLPVEMRKFAHPMHGVPPFQALGGGTLERWRQSLSSTWHEVSRRRFGPIAAGPIAPEIDPALPQRQDQKTADERSPAVSGELERAHREHQESNTGARKQDEPRPIEDRAHAGLERSLRRRRGQALVGQALVGQALVDHAPVQLADERAIRVVLRRLLHQAAPGGR